MKWYFVFLAVLLITGLMILPTAIASFTSPFQIGLKHTGFLYGYFNHSYILGGGDPIDTPADVA